MLGVLLFADRVYTSCSPDGCCYLQLCKALPRLNDPLGLMFSLYLGSRALLNNTVLMVYTMQFASSVVGFDLILLPAKIS